MTYAATGQTGRIYELMASWQTGIPKTCKKWAHYFRNCHYNVFVHTLAAVGNRQEFSFELSYTLLSLQEFSFDLCTVLYYPWKPWLPKNLLYSVSTEQCKNILKLHQTFFLNLSLDTFSLIDRTIKLIKFAQIKKVCLEIFRLLYELFCFVLTIGPKFKFLKHTPAGREWKKW